VGILKKKGLILALARSKGKFPLTILLMMFLMMVPLASAHLESPINSRWAYTVPTIDGTITSGEWTDAAVRDFTLNMRSRSDGSLVQSLSARFYVKNDYTNIYAAVQIFNEDYDARDAANEWDGFFLLFEADHDGVLADGDNGEGVTTWTGSPFYTKNDLYYNLALTFWDADLNIGKTNDGDLSWSHTNPTQNAIGDYTFEMRIPLVGTDVGYDLAITTLPKTVGFKIWFLEGDGGTDGVYPDDPTISKNVEEIRNGATFGDLILHPLYYLTITATAGGTTNPTPGKYPYGYGTEVSVLAIPSGGYIFDHWELDGIPVGSANPYSVTMDMNHTLHAVFRSAPPAVGGMAAPIVIPVNESNLLTPLIWLASAIIPIALTIVFAKLKKKKL
jgi:hypothetical protein